VRVRVSPVPTVLLAVRAYEYRKLPEVRASHTATWVTTSLFVPAQFVHAGRVVVIDFEPAEAADQAKITRVVTEEVAVVPAEPGSAVWSSAYVFVGAVNAVPDSMLSHLFARLTA
jgi:hypothetical protein